MNQQNQLLGLPIELLTRIFDNYLDFEDTVTVFHASRTWRNNLLPRLWSSERLERYQTLVPILWDLHAHELHRLRYTYYPDAPLVHPLHNPRVEFIDALAHFGSRHQNYHIWLNGNNMEIINTLTALRQRSPRFSAVHISRRLPSTHTRDTIDTIVDTNFQQFLFTGSHFQIRRGRYPEFRGIPQVRLTNLQINGFRGNRIAFANYLTARFPNLHVLIITPPVLMRENPALVDNIRRPATLMCLVI